MAAQYKTLLATGASLALALVSSVSHSQPRPPDMILTNGKIITVDDRFSIAEAVALSGEFISAVGTSEAIISLAGDDTRTIDLEGRAVIPGLIDNHMHLLRAGTTWLREVRWDGVGTRESALALLGERVEATSPGEWIFTLGGWTLEQFSDDDDPFTREELDDVAPDNPVLFQATYYKSYLNSAALQELGLEDSAEPWIVRDAAGRATGEIEEAGIRGLVAGLPAPSRQEVETGTAAMIGDLNRAGVTSVGSAGCPQDLLQMYRDWADRDRLDVPRRFQPESR